MPLPHGILLAMPVRCTCSLAVPLLKRCRLVGHGVSNTSRENGGEEGEEGEEGEGFHFGTVFGWGGVLEWMFDMLGPLVIF